MKTRYTVALLLLGLVLPTGEAVGQQAGPTLHRYIVRAVLTAEGLKNLQKQPPTALKAGDQTIELNKETPLVEMWESLRDQVLLDRAHFHSCIDNNETNNVDCAAVSTLMKIVEEARQN